MTLVYGCGSKCLKPKPNEDVLAVGVYGWQYKMRLQDGFYAEIQKPSGFVMYYHDSIFSISIDANSKFTYSSGTISKDYDYYLKKKFRLIPITDTLNADWRDFHLWGCAAPTYYIQIKKGKKSFGMASYSSYRFLGSQKRISEKQVPEKLLALFHELNSLRYDFECSDRYPFKDFRVMNEITLPFVSQRK